MVDDQATACGGRTRRRWGLLLLLAVLLPYWFVAVYAYPSTDDWGYLQMAREHSPLELTIDHYRRWTGRVAATFVLAVGLRYLNPEHWYFLGAWAVLSALLGAMLCLGGRLWGRDADGAPGRAFRWAFLVFLLYASHVGSTVEAFYWWPAAFTYGFAGACAMVLLAVQLPTGEPPGPVRWLAGGTAGVLVCLFSETWLPPLLLLEAGLLFWSWRSRLSTRRLAIGMTVCLLIGAAVALLAPGVWQRQAHFETRIGLFTAGWHAFSLAFGVAEGMLSSPAVLGGSLLLATATRPLAARLGLPARCGWWVAPAWLFGVWAVAASALFPAIYVQNSFPEARVRAVAELLVLLGWLATWFHCCRWLGRPRGDAGRQWLRRLGWAALVVGILASPRSNYRDLWLDIRRRGPAYLAQLTERRAQIAAARAAGTELVVVPALDNPPPTIHYFDITDNPEWPHNRVFADWCGVPAIRVDEFHGWVKVRQLEGTP